MGRLYNRPGQSELRQTLRIHGTPAEARLWSMLKNGQLDGLRFRRQHGVGPYVLDLYCPSARLAIELDGAVHNTPERAAYDAERTRDLNGAGIQVLRFENREVFEVPESVLGALAFAVWS